MARKKKKDVIVVLTQRGGVDETLERVLGKKVSMEKSASGAPYLEGDDHFVSLSHKDNRLVLALSTKPVGVDIERLQDKPSYFRIAATYFDEPIEEGDVEGFFRSWTRREAFGKLLGVGLNREVMALNMKQDRLQYNGEVVCFSEKVIDGYMITVASYFDATEYC